MVYEYTRMSSHILNSTLAVNPEILPEVRTAGCPTRVVKKLQSRPSDEKRYLNSLAGNFSVAHEVTVSDMAYPVIPISRHHVRTSLPRSEYNSLPPLGT